MRMICATAEIDELDDGPGIYYGHAAAPSRSTSSEGVRSRRPGNHCRSIVMFRYISKTVLESVWASVWLGRCATAAADVIAGSGTSLRSNSRRCGGDIPRGPGSCPGVARTDLSSLLLVALTS